jgi:TfoX/Sxy family transcriptional regulator of competence genes
MAYNEGLAQRVRQVLADQPGVVEKKMFGGLTFMLSGNMFCGVLNDDLVVRVGQNSYEEALAASYTRPMDFTGRPLKGMVFVGPDGYRSDEALKKWVRRGIDVALSQPSK